MIVYYIVVHLGIFSFIATSSIAIDWITNSYSLRASVITWDSTTVAKGKTYYWIAIIAVIVGIINSFAIGKLYLVVKVTKITITKITSLVSRIKTMTSFMAKIKLATSLSQSIFSYIIIIISFPPYPY